ncbi:hypothetical protein JTE90_009794 [Oedothorax gibbosus]|uniref:Uncharacterized protein n=1 Tax=Oedothorax gibbosus TaxID=931172 RepID=A0AAV6URJ3_9ARAC|nr:hypothetical protein JTE90_009794 [Oedothorax gibbosus]
MYHLVWIEAPKRKNRNRLRKTLNTRYGPMNTTELQTCWTSSELVSIRQDRLMRARSEEEFSKDTRDSKKSPVIFEHYYKMPNHLRYEGLQLEDIHQAFGIEYWTH